MFPLEAVEQNGYAIAPAVLRSPEAAAVEAALPGLSLARAGTRNLLDLPWCRALAVSVRAALQLDAVAVGEVSCLVNRGDALLLRPLLLHTSAKSSSRHHRRVLHFLFGPASIGYGLQWRYAV